MDKYNIVIRDDISNDFITLGTCFSMFVLQSRLFPLCTDCLKSDSSVDGEPHGNFALTFWMQIIKFQRCPVVASSPSFSHHASYMVGPVSLFLQCNPVIL